ncbi:MAG: TolC family outer membrane protein [Proteobacteria bacterium]|nr:TolC family outer membrane protein [Pseudomonadota bacterium]
MVLAFVASAASAQAQKFTMEEAVRRAVRTNPAVGEASANRRATDFELRQAQGGLLPQVRLQADIGPESRRQYNSPLASQRSGDFQSGRQANIVVRQVIFDGFATINESWRQAYRVDAASWRVKERSELIALDAIQAYTDILRLQDMIGQSSRNIEAHRRLLDNVSARVSGGRAGQGDLDQVRERVLAAEASRAELQMRYGEALALFRRAVDQEPKGLVWPARPAGLPKSRQEALNIAVEHNATLRAAGADVRAVEAQRDAAKGSNMPTVALEGRAGYGKNTQNITGRYDEYSAKLSASWLLYSGGTDTARQNELAERVGENQMRLSVLQRQAIESIDKAWSTRQALNDRIRALSGQINSAERVIGAYRSEYELGTRTLLDLLNAEQVRYNAAVGLINAKGLALFADYQLLAASGTLLSAMKVQLPGEAHNAQRGARENGALFPAFERAPAAPRQP